jgi:hypothetical protein
MNGPDAAERLDHMLARMYKGMIVVPDAQQIFTPPDEESYSMRHTTRRTS